MKKCLKGPNKARFEHIFKTGQVIHQSPFRIIHVPGRGAWGIATAKVIGCKPARNHVKRQVREIIRSQKSCLNDTRDYVVIVKESATKMSFQNLEVAFSALVRRIQVNEEGSNSLID